MEQMVENKDFERLNELHFEYNDVIYKAGRNNRLHQMITNLADYITCFTRLATVSQAECVRQLKNIRNFGSHKKG